LSGAAQQVIGPISAYTHVYGLAGLNDKVYGFPESGEIVEVDLGSGATQVVVPASQGHSWWGAGVSTRSIKQP
jgi:hypothetical protein